MHDAATFTSHPGERVKNFQEGHDICKQGDIGSQWQVAVRKYSHSEVYRSRTKSFWGWGYNGEDQKRFSTAGIAQTGVLSSSGQYECEDGQRGKGGC